MDSKIIPFLGQRQPDPPKPKLRPLAWRWKRMGVGIDGLRFFARQALDANTGEWVQVGNCLQLEPGARRPRGPAQPDGELDLAPKKKRPPKGPS